MSKKVWKFKYEDDMIKSWDSVIEDHFRTAKNRHLFQNCPIEYDDTTGKCYIYSDEEIPGLKLVGTDEIKQTNRNSKEAFEAMNVTIQGVEI